MLENQEASLRADLALRSSSCFSPTFLETILRHLLLPSNKIVKRGVEIFVPEVCYFEEGEPASFYFNRDIDVTVS
jgi:hypothetical protein